jgi:hypothetical protein
MKNSGQQFHLVIDSPDLSGITPGYPVGPAARGSAFPKVDVPVGLSYLSAVAGCPKLAADMPPSMKAVFVLETVTRLHQPQLLLISPANLRARVNGQPAPRVAVLRVKDQIQVRPDYLLHVTLYNRPVIGPPPATAVGKECPICRGRLTADTTVYLCPGCATFVHCEGEEKGGERLECVHLSSNCPVCGAAVELQEGYAYIPEFFGG